MNIIFASPTGSNLLSDDLKLIDFEYARPVTREYTRSEDIHEALHCAIKMNPIFKLLFPQHQGFPGTEMYRIQSDLMQQIQHEYDDLEDALGSSRDSPFKDLMVQLYALAPPMTGDGVHSTPQYDAMLSVLSSAIGVFEESKN